MNRSDKEKSKNAGAWKVMRGLRSKETGLRRRGGNEDNAEEKAEDKLEDEA